MKKILLNAPIIPQEGMGEIQLGSNISCIKKAFDDSHKNWQGHFSAEDKSKFTVHVGRPFLKYLTFDYDQKLQIRVDLFTGQIRQLHAKKGYKGAYRDKIKINTKIGQVFDLLEDHSFDCVDHVVLFDALPHIVFVIGPRFGGDFEKKEEIENKRIQEIWIGQ